MHSIRNTDKSGQTRNKIGGLCCYAMQRTAAITTKRYWTTDKVVEYANQQLRFVICVLAVDSFTNLRFFRPRQTIQWQTTPYYVNNASKHHDGSYFQNNPLLDSIHTRIKEHLSFCQILLGLRLYHLLGTPISSSKLLFSGAPRGRFWWLKHLPGYISINYELVLWKNQEN